MSPTRCRPSPVPTPSLTMPCNMCIKSDGASPKQTSNTVMDAKPSSLQTNRSGIKAYTLMNSQCAAHQSVQVVSQMTTTTKRTGRYYPNYHTIDQLDAVILYRQNPVPTLKKCHTVGATRVPVHAQNEPVICHERTTQVASKDST